MKLLGFKLEEYEAKPYYLINSVLLDSQVPIHDLFNVNSLTHRCLDEDIVDEKILVWSLPVNVATGVIVATDECAPVVASHFRAT